MKLRDRIAIVTGGGTGIGASIAECLAAEGARLVLAQRRVALAEAEAARLRRRGTEAIALRCDLGKQADIKRLVAMTVKRFGGVDILVNNGAITGISAIWNFLEEPKRHLDQVIDVNLKGTFLLAQAAARVMVKQKRKGVIINISSIAQLGALECASAYCAAKAGLDGFCKTVALELGRFGIRVVNVAPGEIAVSAHKQNWCHLKRAKTSGKFWKNPPLGRLGRADEVGRIVAFLASDDASYVTGSTWVADGGWLAY